jgi:N-acyl-D-aspartate/D-glutamate deacylase
MTFDTVIRGGRVVDGTGAPARPADVGVRDGVIVEVGDRLDGDAPVVVDARGCVVAPGFVDPHTHLDVQLCWDGAASPSSLHGVTSVVLGICGFGIAPCRDGSGEYLLRSLEAVEEIPYASASLGVGFEWRTWGEFMQHLAGRGIGVNVAGMVPHSALRYFVMGERGRAERATADDRAAMRAELLRSFADGALGFATSRGPNHKDAFGDPVPSRAADDDELRALVDACDGRVWQINVATKFSGDARDLNTEVDRYAAWSAAAGARLTWSPLFAEPGSTVWREVLDHNRALNEHGTVAPQVNPQSVTVALRFDRPSVAALVPGWAQAMERFFAVSRPEQLELLRTEDFRAELRAAPEDPSMMFAPDYSSWTISTSPTRNDLLGVSLREAGRTTGQGPLDFLCDLLSADDLGTELQVPAVNRDRAAAAEMCADEHALVALGDAGAHVTSVTSYTYPTDLLARVVRDEGRMTIEAAVQRITSRPARFFGLDGRGELRPGFAADVCVFDLDALGLAPLGVRHDFPGGAARLYRAARGYTAILVNGELTVEHDEYTGRRPGQLVRR